MSKQPPPAPTASATGPCPTIIQISRTPRHWKFTQHLRTTRPPPLTRMSEVLGRYPVWPYTVVSPSADSREASVSYWHKCVHKVLVNSLGSLSLPRKSMVRLTDRPDMTLDVYCGRKATTQQQKQRNATSKTIKEPKQKSRLGTASNKITGGLHLVCGRSTFALCSALVPQTISYSVYVEDS